MRHRRLGGPEEDQAGEGLEVRARGLRRVQALRAALAADQGQGRVGQPLPQTPARLRRRVHGVGRPRRGGGPGRGPGELGAEPHHRPAARRPVHAGEGEPAAHRQPPAPRVDGGRRQRPYRPADDARQGRRQGVVRAQALHRPARERRRDARRAGPGEDGRRGGRRPRRRLRAGEADQLRPRPLRAGPRGEAGAGRRRHRRDGTRANLELLDSLGGA